MTEQEKKDRQRASMRNYYHKTAKHKSKESNFQKNAGWTYLFVGNNLKRVHEIYHVI